MKKILPFLLLLLVFLSVGSQAQITPDAAGILYVKKNSNGNGSSWSNAIGELAYALKAANGSTAIQQVWVAAGVYQPGFKYPDANQPSTPGNRENSFSIARSYKVYGGFAGTEQTINERQLNDPAFRTVLSGDFQNNDQLLSTAAGISFSNVEENAYTVVTVAPGVDYELNGLTITGGNCPQNFGPGAGMKVHFSARSVLSHLRITGNVSEREGAALHTDAGRLIMFNCFIANNQAAQAGGGMYCINFTEASINNTVLARNFAIEGAALYTKSGGITFSNCTLVENNGSSDFNAISGERPSTVYIYNNIIRQTSTGNTIFPNQLSNKINYMVRNCLLQTESFPGSDAPGASFSTEDPLLAAPSLLDYRLLPNSPAVDKGLNPMYNISWHLFNLQTDLDMNGTRRLIGPIVDIGAYELNGQLQEINLDNLAGTYGDADFEIPVSTSSGLPVSLSSSDPSIADVYPSGNKWMMKMKIAGKVTITATQAGNDQYLSREKQVEMEVKKRVFTFHIAEKSKTYGEQDPFIGFTFSGNLPGEFFTGAPVREPGEDVGEYEILPGDLDAGPNYIVNVPKVVFSILPKTLYVTPDFVQKFYGEPDPVLTYDVQGLINYDQLTGNISREPGEDAGSYDFTLGTLKSSDNYTIFFVSEQLVIHPQWLTVSPELVSRPYGEPNPTINLQYNGFANGEGPDDIIPPDISTSAELNSPPGNYVVLLTGGSASNYRMILNGGVLNIRGAVVQLQQHPESQSVCEGNTVSLSVDANATSPIVNLQYQWEKKNNGNDNWERIAGAGSQILNHVSEPGSYRCVITAPGTIIRSDPAELVQNKKPVPKILAADKICMNDGTVTLSATPAGGLFSGTGIHNSHWNLEIPGAGKHEIHYSVTDVNGCTGEAVKTVELQTCFDRGDGISILKALAYPNPTTGQLTLKLLTGVADNWYINVSNQEGRSLLQKKVELRKGWNMVTVQIGHLPSGMYTISAGRGGFWKQGIQVIKQ